MAAKQFTPEVSSENSNLVISVFLWVRVQAQLMFEKAATITVWFGLEREAEAALVVHGSLLGLSSLCLTDIIVLQFLVWQLAPVRSRTQALVLVTQCDIVSASFYSLEISQ